MAPGATVIGSRPVGANVPDLPATRTSTVASRSDGFATRSVLDEDVTGRPARRRVRLGGPCRPATPGRAGRWPRARRSRSRTRPPGRGEVWTSTARSSVCGAMSARSIRRTVCGASVMPSVATVSTGPSGPSTVTSRTAGPGSTLASSSDEEWSSPAPAPVNHHRERGAGQPVTPRLRAPTSERDPNSPAASAAGGVDRRAAVGGTSVRGPRRTSTGAPVASPGPAGPHRRDGGLTSDGRGQAQGDRRLPDGRSARRGRRTSCGPRPRR